MNTPPTDGRRVGVEELRTLVHRIFASVPIPDKDARLVADLLIDTELRGVVSHGVLQVERYVSAYRDGTANPQPEVRVLRQGPTTAALSGDGGLGMIVGTQAMGMAIDKARELGLGAVTATYHDHIGSAGKYCRMAMAQDMIGICFSGRNAAPEYRPNQPLRGSIQGSPPLAIGMPAGPDQADFMVDMATGMAWDEECFAKMPAVYFKGLGIAHVANIMSGTLGGQMAAEFDRRNIQYSGANQSSFYMALAIERFVDVEAFKADMDHLTTQTAQMMPYPGYEAAQLPGGPEWQRQRAYSREGIPIGREAVEQLERVAGSLDVEVPW